MYKISLNKKQGVSSWKGNYLRLSLKGVGCEASDVLKPRGDIIYVETVRRMCYKVAKGKMGQGDAIVK